MFLQPLLWSLIKALKNGAFDISSVGCVLGVDVPEDELDLLRLHHVCKHIFILCMLID